MRSTDNSVNWDGWTVVLALTVSIATFMLTVLLDKVGAWPQIPWANFALAAICGAIAVQRRHPGHSVLTFVLFPPILFFATLIAVMFLGLGGGTDGP